MQKKKAKKKVAVKSFFRKAGEVLGTIGHELAEGKDKAVEVSHTIMDGISHNIEAVKKLAVKKTVKKAAKKLAKKVAKKVSKKAAKKVAKKAVKRRPLKNAAKKIKKAVKK